MKNPVIIAALLLLSHINMPAQDQVQGEATIILPVYSGKYNSTSLGPNVYVFDPSMDMAEIQALLDTIFASRTIHRSEFTDNRTAIMFKPGRYNLDVKLDYYMQVLGLGDSPEDVVIVGAVRSNTTHGNSVLTNFWRSAENLTVIPSDNSTMVWGVSQAAPLRRILVKGDLQLFDKGYASGGFLANSRIEGKITSGPQQQWFTRNSSIKEWVGGVWNMTFLGIDGAPQESWPEKPYTTIGQTPVIREKPWLLFANNDFVIRIPALRENTSGPDWLSEDKPVKTLGMNKIYIAHPEIDNSETLNAALKKGNSLLLTPGRYLLDTSLKVRKKGTLIMGTGLATLIPQRGNAALEIDDAGGVIVCGLTIDAGPVYSERLFAVGRPGSGKSHSGNPVFLYDIFFRVGGPAEGSAGTCLEINSNDVIVDHTWLWRADHGNGVGWDKNKGAHGLVVNGDNVIIYGLFNEHFQEYQTVWNGNNGKVYFYQSEMPYDPPSVESWKHGKAYGYASYKVSDNVKNHEAWGVGIYNYFRDAPIIVDNAIETPAGIEDKMHHVVIYWLNGNMESVVKSIINGKGGGVSAANRKAVR